jgi:hypothetical protein
VTPERRAELEALRARKRADRERAKVAQWMRDNYSRALFGTQPDDQAERIYRALGR